MKWEFYTPRDNSGVRLLHRCIEPYAWGKVITYRKIICYACGEIVPPHLLTIAYILDAEIMIDEDCKVYKAWITFCKLSKLKE